MTNYVSIACLQKMTSHIVAQNQLFVLQNWCDVNVVMRFFGFSVMNE